MTESQIREKVVGFVIDGGLGRPAIMDLLPEATEWQVRKYVREAKRINREKERPNLRINAPNKEVIATLRPIRVNAPKHKTGSKKYSDVTTVAFVGDTHGEYLDQKAFSVACQIIEDEDVDIMVHLGDLMDFYTISRFDKDPSRRVSIQDDLIHGAKTLGTLNGCVRKDTRRLLFQGNHTARLKMYIEKNAPALHDLDLLKIDNLLGLDELGWEYIAHDLELFPEFLVKHGEYVSANSGYTARKEMTEAWMSGISGHVHRLAMHYFTPRRNFLRGEQPSIWIENGHLSTMQPEYIKGNPNWQQGFTIMKVTKDGTFIPNLIHIVNGKAYHNGKVYSG